MLESFVSTAFEYKKLTEAEQKARGILGRLVGVIADTKKPTRNGRKYSEKLWENVFENPIMKEKIANRCCFGELNHPADRSEVDLERVAICLAEHPQKGPDGQLYGVFDILSTPNGRILKALCDYGCKIGISSRGQGDLITDDDGEEAVDPDTYDCECFDAVIVPGVEKARLKYVTESLSKDKSLKQTLTESLNAANADERKIMEETLDMLKIKLEEDKKEEEEDIDTAPEADIEEAEPKDSEVNDVESDTEDDFSDLELDKDFDDIATFDDEEIPEDEDTAESAEDTEEEEKSDADIFLHYLANNFDEEQIKKVCDILDIDIEDNDSNEDEEESDNETSDNESDEENNDMVDVDDATDLDSEKITDEDADTSSEDIIDTSDKTEEEVDEAIDNGTSTLVNSLKEALEKNADLESSVKSLQETLAVRDAKVTELDEDCNRYKASIARLSTIAKSNKALKENISSLEEQLKEKEILIESQKSRISRLAQEKTESAKTSREVTALTESLSATKADHESQIKALNEKMEKVASDAQAREKALTEDLAKQTKLRESYKNLANSAINKYIDVKADILGVTAKDIKRKLGEKYTLSDVDQVCEDLKSYQLNVSKLPFSVNRKVSIKVNEAATKVNAPKNPHLFEDDEVDATLLKLADFTD